MLGRRLLWLGCIFAAIPTAFAAISPVTPSVQPSGDSVPANLLRISLVFPQAPDGEVLPRILLSHADGRVIDQPFLPQELWSPDGRVLTILLHPGRVKTGLVAREELGPILVAGDDVVLSLDGRPVQRWHVAPVDAQGPQVSAWLVAAVTAGSRSPLVVTLDAPVDGRDAGDMAIAGPDGRRLTGQGRLGPGEASWIFTPASPWQAGEYRLMVHGTLEDPAGNRPGEAFEAAGLSKVRSPSDASIPFQVDALTRPP